MAPTSSDVGCLRIRSSVPESLVVRSKRRYASRPTLNRRSETNETHRMGGIVRDRGSICWSRGCSAGFSASNKSRKYDRKDAIAAVREKHGRGRGGHARGKVLLQTHAGNEYLRAPSDAQRPSKQ